MRRFYVFTLILLILGLALVACGGTEDEPEQEVTTEEEAAAEEEVAEAPEEEAMDEPLKVAFVYVAPIGDLGWTFAHEQARLELEEEFGDDIETAFIENVPEGAESERVIRDFAQKGYDLIFTTSFGYMDPTITVAQEYPDTQFVHISGYKNADNVSTVFGRMYQPRYLSGIAAGAATESNLVGYVAAFPIPEVIRGINAFSLGVKEANPDAEVRVVWTNTWFDPPQEKEAAEALVSIGADVIAQHQDTTEPQKAAADAGGLSISYNTEMSDFVGDTVLTGPVWNWYVKYSQIANDLVAGTYAGDESYWGGLDDGIVGLASYSDRVSDDTIALIAEKEELIASGEWDVFCGPITGADGEILVAEGECLNDGQMLSMSCFVEGAQSDEGASTAACFGE